MLIRRLAQLGALVLVAVGAVVLPAAPAMAGGPDCDVWQHNCEIVIELPEQPGDPGPDPVTGTTPGPAECVLNLGGGKYQKVPCSSDTGSWSNDSQCYWMLNPNQQAAPPGSDPAGAWYLCTPLTGAGGFIVGTNHWLNTPPPGLGLTPGQAARRIVQTMQFEGLDIGMAPQVNPQWGYRRSYVGVPIWLWAETQTQQNYGPWVVTATLGGQTITVNAHVTSVIWNMGDGGSTACGNPGTAYQVQYGVVDSPSCGYRYQQMSNDQPGNRFTVTATSQWAIDWTGSGQSGSIPLTTQSSDTVEIRELQSVNVTSLQ